LRSIFERTGDPDILLAAIPGIDKSEDRLIRTRIEAILDKVSMEEGGAYGDGYNLLLSLLERTPQAAKHVFVRYLHTASAQRCHTVSEILQRRNPSWSTELLQPLLKDKRPTGYTHAVSVRESESRLPIRVCDAAAKALSRWDKQLKFTMVGTNEELDREIQTILDQLAHGQHK
jgi:hypothetical protein